MELVVVGSLDIIPLGYLWQSNCITHSAVECYEEIWKPENGGLLLILGRKISPIRLLYIIIRDYYLYYISMQ